MRELRLDAVGAVCAHVINQQSNGMNCHLRCRVRAQEWQHKGGLGDRRIKPEVIVLLFEDGRHPVVSLRQQFVRRGRDEGAGLCRLALTVAPRVPEARKGERSPVRHVEEERLLARTLLLPLEEPRPWG